MASRPASSVPLSISDVPLARCGPLCWALFAFWRCTSGIPFQSDPLASPARTISSLISELILLDVRRVSLHGFFCFFFNNLSVEIQNIGIPLPWRYFTDDNTTK
eukprot:TRINITY_DN4082_c0_g1_i1.p2 TRINITY_DN4082_c0_g1~~TRINITY_DN4082_c0_g1_i1.p2  ORF type:complete len:104 (+),score=1.90 TRINITY_DN4082_c0_g1_i1:604-915(+)